MTAQNPNSTENAKDAAQSEPSQDLDNEISADAAEKVKGGFNPQPDPPAMIRGFDPQPDPPLWRNPKQGL